MFILINRQSQKVQNKKLKSIKRKEESKVTNQLNIDFFTLKKNKWEIKRSNSKNSEEVYEKEEEKKSCKK